MEQPRLPRDIRHQGAYCRRQVKYPPPRPCIFDTKAPITAPPSNIGRLHYDSIEIFLSLLLGSPVATFASPKAKAPHGQSSVRRLRQANCR